MLRHHRILSPVVVATVALISSGAGGSSQESQQRLYRQVADGVYAALQAPGSTSATSGFVIGSEGVWVIDALRPEIVAEMRAEIRKLTPLPVKYVINSHHHYELVLGNSSYPQATVVAHENVRKNLIETPPVAQMERTRADYRRLGLSASAPEADLPSLRLPELTYTDRLTFHDGDRELQVIHLGRYHTDADSILFLPREKVLFSGDLLPGLGGPGGQREAHFREFIRSIDKALALDFEIIVPGRGNRLATRQDLVRFQQYLVETLNRVQAFIDRGATLEETQEGMQPPDYIDPSRRSSASFKRLWADTVRRAYRELKSPNEGAGERGALTSSGGWKIS